MIDIVPSNGLLICVPVYVGSNNHLLNNVTPVDIYNIIYRLQIIPLKAL